MNRHRYVILLVAGFAFVAGIVFRGSIDSGNQTHLDTVDDGSTDQIPEFFTCSMHPHVHKAGPGDCPICAMDLIPVFTNQDSKVGHRELTLSPRAMKLAEVQSVRVERKFVTANVRMVGKVEYDESKVAYITSWVPGRLDRLFVDYTGVNVQQGDHLVELFSPELLQAQEELISAVSTATDLSSSRNEYLRDRRTANVDSAREKLRLWGLTDEQIKSIEAKGKGEDHITISSPISGVVVHKNAVEGMYVQTGSRVYTIADLSEVWVKLDAYESDLPWLHYGQEVEFHTEAYPGDIFTGQIAFIDPILNSLTRTVKIRVNLPNPEGKLKPNMFVRAVVKSQVAAGGRVMDAGLAGKWISPMHPEIVKNAPGQCDICGMDLVSSESLGYVAAEDDSAPLVIPASAPLITGRRAVVYVDHGAGKFEGREISLGARAGEFYLVESGLVEGEKVVTQGNFKIDSAIQILAKPSMMNPLESEGSRSDAEHGRSSESSSGAKTPSFNVSKEFRTELGKFVGEYISLKDELSHDHFDPSGAWKSDLAAVLETIETIETIELEGKGLSVWRARLGGLKGGLEALGVASDLPSARTAFETLSNALLASIRDFGFLGAGTGTDAMGQSMFRYHCPMAFGGRGADWLQVEEGTENPYYGSKMFGCGSLEETFVSSQGESPTITHGGHTHE